MPKPDMKFAADQVKKLDQWAYGFMTGTLFGIVFTLGLLVVITEPLK